MKTRVSVLAAAAFACAAPLAAEKLPQEFRAAFERTFAPKRTYAVVVQPGVPTTSIYGTDGKESQAHYSVDVIDGRWKTSDGFLDLNQVAVDFLAQGEVVELDSIAYRDNRVDLRMVSIENHKVTRGSGFLKDTKPEPVATNFKFFLPYPKTQVVTAAEAPKVVGLVQAYLKPFANPAEARLYAAQLMTGGASKARAPSKPAGTAKKEIKAGMTALEVIDILGKPQKEVSFQSQTKWTYPDLEVIFENGRVKEVRF